MIVQSAYNFFVCEKTIAVLVLDLEGQEIKNLLCVISFEKIIWRIK